MKSTSRVFCVDIDESNSNKNTNFNPTVPAHQLIVALFNTCCLSIQDDKEMIQSTLSVLSLFSIFSSKQRVRKDAIHKRTLQSIRHLE